MYPHQPLRRRFLKNAAAAALALPLLGLSAVKRPNPTLPLIKPARLPQGGTLGLVAPATVIRQDEKLEKTLAVFKEAGFRVKTGVNARQQFGYLAGTDQERAADLMAMFTDPEVHAILPIQGGWGSARMLPYLDFDLIRQNPKILVGFSDITALLVAIYTRAGLVTFHGPNGFSEWTPLTWQFFSHSLIEGQPYDMPGTLPDIKDLVKGRYSLVPGIATGELVGGNLTVLSNMIGSAYVPDFQGKILLLEDIDEAVYRVDRMLTQLALSGILQQVNGVVFASCAYCKPREESYDFSLQRMLKEKLQPFGKPAFFGSYIGHLQEQYTLPIGVKVTIDADQGLIRVDEPGVV
jgi:muramoyltetrapeptide carboxypeptidase